MLAAVRFLTILPLGRREREAEELGRAAAYFPLVGACLGLALAGLDVALESVLAPQPRTAALLGVLALLTGGLHLDGLMDSFDGLFGGGEPVQRLAIMRDSRVGTYGAVAAIVVVLLQYACLAELRGWTRLSGLVAMATLSRWAMVYLTASFPYARSEGLGAAFKTTGSRQLALASLFATAVVAALGPIALALLGVAWLSARAFAACALARVPGLTGDLYGASNEIVATVVLLALAAAQEKGLWLGW